MQRELRRLHRFLKKEGIGHVFLKGAYPAQLVYPRPGLHPVRDLDVMVPGRKAFGLARPKTFPRAVVRPYIFVARRRPVCNPRRF